MMNIIKNQSLKEFNTFGLAARSHFFCRVKSIQELTGVLKGRVEPFMVLGGGSNVLFTQDFEGLIIKNEIKGISVVREDEQSIFVKVGAGEIWHDFVLHCIEQQWGGIENLSLIPGTVGAAPMQNIGAYGVEIKEVFHSLTALNIDTLETRLFDRSACEFGYRESVFKRALKGQCIIVDVTFKLSKSNHKINTSYGAIQEELIADGVSQPTMQDVSRAVIKIRQSKLPDPQKIGNSGSFFKNPTIATDQYNVLKMTHPKLPGYVVSKTEMKVPAGWLIEQCGWKGYREGNVGVHQHQALVLVHYGDGNGLALKILAQRIQQSVKEKFNIDLQTEVNII